MKIEVVSNKFKKYKTNINVGGLAMEQLADVDVAGVAIKDQPFDHPWLLFINSPTIWSMSHLPRTAPFRAARECSTGIVHRLSGLL